MKQIRESFSRDVRVKGGSDLGQRAGRPRLSGRPGHREGPQNCHEPAVPGVRAVLVPPHHHSA